MWSRGDSCHTHARHRETQGGGPGRWPVQLCVRVAKPGAEVGTQHRSGPVGCRHASASCRQWVSLRQAPVGGGRFPRGPPVTSGWPVLGNPLPPGSHSLGSVGPSAGPERRGHVEIDVPASPLPCTPESHGTVTWAPSAPSAPLHPHSRGFSEATWSPAWTVLYVPGRNSSPP